MSDKSPQHHPPPSQMLDVEKYRARIAADYPDQAQQEEVLQILWNIASMMVGMSWNAEHIHSAFKHIFEKAGADSSELSESSIALDKKGTAND